LFRKMMRHGQFAKVAGNMRRVWIYWFFFFRVHRLKGRAFSKKNNFFLSLRRELFSPIKIILVKIPRKAGSKQPHYRVDYRYMSKLQRERWVMFLLDFFCKEYYHRQWWGRYACLLLDLAYNSKNHKVVTWLSSVDHNTAVRRIPSKSKRLRLARPRWHLRYYLRKK
jgi:hypothetical protein